jgi:hypothetical protein
MEAGMAEAVVTALERAINEAINKEDPHLKNGCVMVHLITAVGLLLRLKTNLDFRSIIEGEIEGFFYSKTLAHTPEYVLELAKNIDEAIQKRLADSVK